MKSFYKRIISGALAFVTLFFVCMPIAFASDAGVLDTPQRGDFWAWLQRGDNAFKSIFNKDICPQSPNTNGLHEFVKTTTTVDGKTGLYYVCRYCGKSAGEVGEEAYQQQVESLPAPGYNSDGSLLVPVTGWTYSGVGSFIEVVSSSTKNVSIEARYTHDSGSSSLGAATSEVFSVPVVGTYSLVFPSGVKYISSLDYMLFIAVVKRSVDDGKTWSTYETLQIGGSDIGAVENGGHVSFPCFSPSSFSFSSNYLYKMEIHLNMSLGFGNSEGFAGAFKFSDYVYFKCTSLDSSINSQYSITTRPTTITGGNYGIVGDDGQIITINNPTKIINEGDNIYYNPATGQTYTITDWTYNYDNRIYNITLDTGDKVSVEYGDENITITENNIVEGDTIVNNYTIYYMIDGSGSGDNPSPSPDPGPTATTCPHSWKEASRTEPTCTAPGSASFSCEKCGETKTDKLPATGHTWQVLRTVQTAYDEEGNLVQQGYTIYQCAVCSEQYKDDQGTGPPGGGDKDDGKETIWDKIKKFFGTITDGIFGIIESIIGKLLDGLNSLAEMLMEKLGTVVDTVLTVFDEVPRLFGGFLDFLGLVFPFLPSEITLLLTFGVIAVVFIGIIKAIRR